MKDTSNPSPRNADGAAMAFARVVGLGRRLVGAVVITLLSLPDASVAWAQSGGTVGGTVVSATSVPLARPTGVAFDAAGNLYLAVTDQQTILKVDASGNRTTVAGTGVQGFSGDGGLATAAMLDSPTGLAVDAAGDVYVADSHNQRVRRVDATTGVITTVAGDGTAGYAGDDGLATAAMLDRPGALSIDAAGDLFIADTNNHRVRRVDAVSGTISTVAGDGVQGYSGDGGPATAAEIDSPDGLAISAAGMLYLADTHNNRIRTVNLAAGATTLGTITTVAGGGAGGGLAVGGVGDGLVAAQAALASPHGLTVDGQGNLYLADTSDERIRRIDAATGVIKTVVGFGAQGFSGDGGAATAAALDAPRAVAISPAAAVTLADTGNDRVRQVVTDASLQTIAGLGGASPGTLSLAAASVVGYGTGAVTATLNTNTAATGAVTFLDVTGASPVTLGSIGLTANAATESIASLSATAHMLVATYAGDATHQAAASTATTVTVRPAALLASANAVSIAYGAPLPALTGTLNGLLAQDQKQVSVQFSTAATVASPPGVYPITASLSGAAAANYQLSLAAGSGQLTINRAPVTVSLTALTNAFAVGAPESFTTQVISSTSGTPTGSATLFNGSTALQTKALSTGGVAVFTVSSLAAGTHSLTASYTGSAEYQTAASQPFVATVGGGGAATTADFTLTATGATSATVQAGSSSTFGFNVAESAGGLSSPILLAASGLPIGAVASFSPAQVPPGTTNAAVTLTIQAPNPPPAAVEIFGGHGSGVAIALCLLLWPWCMRRRGRRRLWSGAVGWMVVAAAAGILLGLMGCGDRVYSTATTTTATTYSIQVNATATAANGNALVHSTTVLLTVQ